MCMVHGAETIQGWGLFRLTQAKINNQCGKKIQRQKELKEIRYIEYHHF